MRIIVFVLLVCWARAASAQTVKPSDFDPSLRARDALVLKRLSGGVSALGVAEPGRAWTFAVTRGVLTVEENWMIDPGTGEDVLRGRVAFTPGPKAPACRSVRIVQAARVEQKLDHDIDWSSGQQNRNLIRTRADAERGVTPGYFIDHDAIKCAPGSPCSPYFRDSWPNPDESADGANAPGDERPASLVDYPFGWTYFERISLESCARCADTGQFLACAQWGGTWPTTGDRSLREASAADSPSPTVLSALGLFDAFYPPAKP